MATSGSVVAVLQAEGVTRWVGVDPERGVLRWSLCELRSAELQYKLLGNFDVCDRDVEMNLLRSRAIGPIRATMLWSTLDREPDSVSAERDPVGRPMGDLPAEQAGPEVRDRVDVSRVEDDLSNSKHHIRLYATCRRVPQNCPRAPGMRPLTRACDRRRNRWLRRGC